MALFEEFYNNKAELQRINKSHIVLIPKKVGVTRPDQFMPISLQNCSLKIVSKALTSRLQPLIPFLVHPDQTGFIKGRSISENFIYAAELTQTCYKRRVPAVALKLDFRKAFDSIEWPALDVILEAKNFPLKWRQWVQDILTSSQTAVLLIGTPGKWINCKKGWRRGDPLLPYLFILVADVLQQLITAASTNGVFEHPICPSAPRPVLQYADDTLFILKADENQLLALKDSLQAFSAATGLHINFEKSTFLPICVDTDVTASLASIFGCPVSSFPQPYLGLPLSTTKLSVR